MRSQSTENLALILILLVTISRLIPHPPNFTPVLSIALFSGAIFQSKGKSFAIPFIGLILSNFILGFYSISWIVMGIMVGITALGFRLKFRKSTVQWFSYSIMSSLIFFVLSNFSVWLWGNLYPTTFSGFSTCFLMAIPFFKNTLLSTLIYSLALFEGNRLIEFILNRNRKALVNKGLSG